MRRCFHHCHRWHCSWWLGEALCWSNATGQRKLTKLRRIGCQDCFYNDSTNSPILSNASHLSLVLLFSCNGEWSSLFCPCLGPCFSWWKACPQFHFAEASLVKSSRIPFDSVLTKLRGRWSFLIKWGQKCLNWQAWSHIPFANKGIHSLQEGLCSLLTVTYQNEHLPGRLEDMTWGSRKKRDISHFKRYP